MTNESNNTNPVKSTKARRWIRFRLRTLLVMVMLLSVPLGWVSWEMDQRRREKEVVAWVEEMGGGVQYSSSSPNDKRNWWGKTTDKWFGERVWFVIIFSTHESNFSPLAELKNLKYLRLQATQMSDLSPLAELENLKRIHLQATQVSDLSPLTELSNLRTLLLINNTQMSDLSPLAELKNLQWLYLKSTQVSDFSPIMGLKNLEQLYLQNTNVSEEQVQKLRLALPNCEISF